MEEESIERGVPDTAEHTLLVHCSGSSVGNVEEHSGDNDDTRHPGWIPATGRGNSEDGQRWLNPSAMQLYRACERKNKPIEHRDTDAVAMIHGQVLNQTWASILEFESLHYQKCAEPKLDRFEGLSTKLSMKARLLTMAGFDAPFDRHDWFVDRCGTEIRYIIDYHSGSTDRSPLIIDARPDLRRLSNAIDRLRATYHRRKMQRQMHAQKQPHISQSQS